MFDTASRTPSRTYLWWTRGELGLPCWWCSVLLMSWVMWVKAPFLRADISG